MAESETRAAFIIAALVLLVMPIVYVMGLAAAMLTMQITPWRNEGGVMLSIAVLWGLIVTSGILIAARRISRRSARA